MRGGAELLVEGLRTALLEHGHQVEVVALPFKWYPSTAVVDHAVPWRLVDLTESQGRPIDRYIPTKFPAYLAHHPDKVTWLFHQFRQAYDLHGTAFGDLQDTPTDRWVRARVMAMDRRALPQSRAIYTIAANVSHRLRRYNGLESLPLHPPPPLGERYRCDRYGGFVLSAGRLERIKRVDLLLEALTRSRSGLRCVVAGTGPEAASLQQLARRLGLERRVEFAGFVPDERLLELYATCRAVYYAPYDEDYGFVTLESLRSSKPVLTTHDAGGVLEFVRDGETGLVTTADAPALAAALDRLEADPAACEAMGRRGCGETTAISWERVLAHLLAPSA